MNKDKLEPVKTEVPMSMVSPPDADSTIRCSLCGQDTRIYVIRVTCSDKRTIDICCGCVKDIDNARTYPTCEEAGL
jgi:hypothetical protein